MSKVSVSLPSPSIEPNMAFALQIVASPNAKSIQFDCGQGFQDFKKIYGKRYVQGLPNGNYICKFKAININGVAKSCLPQSLMIRVGSVQTSMQASPSSEASSNQNNTTTSTPPSAANVPARTPTSLSHPESAADEVKSAPPAESSQYIDPR